MKRSPPQRAAPPLRHSSPCLWGEKADASDVYQGVPADPKARLDGHKVQKANF